MADAVIIKFPEKICAMCGLRATKTISLVCEDGSDAGQKHLCDEYPFCEKPLPPAKQE